MVTSSEDGTVKIWDTRSGLVQRDYPHGSPVNDVVIHPNQGELISCDQAGNVRIWDLGENKCTHQLIPEDDVPVRSVTVATDGSMLVAGNNLVSQVHHFTSARAKLTGVSGQLLRLAHDPEPRSHTAHASNKVPGAHQVHNPRPALARCAPSRDMLGGPHRQDLVRR